MKILRYFILLLLLATAGTVHAMLEKAQTTYRSSAVKPIDVYGLYFYRLNPMKEVNKNDSVDSLNEEDDCDSTSAQPTTLDLLLKEFDAMGTLSQVTIDKTNFDEVNDNHETLIMQAITRSSEKDYFLVLAKHLLENPLIRNRITLDNRVVTWTQDMMEYFEDSNRYAYILCKELLEVITAAMKQTSSDQSFEVKN